MFKKILSKLESFVQKNRQKEIIQMVNQKKARNKGYNQTGSNDDHFKTNEASKW